MQGNILTLSRVRYFARRTRDYCRAYLKLENDADGIESKDSIEKMRKTCKAHRNIIDMEPGFIDTVKDFACCLCREVVGIGRCGRVGGGLRRGYNRLQVGRRSTYL